MEDNRVRDINMKYDVPVYTLMGNVMSIPIQPNFDNWLQNFDRASDGKYRIVYFTKNLINGKIYVGQHTTNNFSDGYLGSGLVVKRAIKKYGKENFETRFCCFCETRKDLDVAEQYWISYFEAIKYGYNIAIGGGGGDLGAEVNKRISEGVRKADLEGRRKNRKGDNHPKIWLGVATENHPMYNHVYTEETLQKMRDSHADVSGEKNPNFGKKQEIVTCPVCGKSGGIYAMIQWHGLEGEKCKQKPKSDE